MTVADPYRLLREEMVEFQLAARGIRDERVLQAMREVPRERFVDLLYLSRAYDDSALPIGWGQTISQPYMVAVMTEALELKGDEAVLEIGTGSGYQAAVLARLARRVFTIERIEPLAARARGLFEETGIRNVVVRSSDGTQGWPEEAPFDGIIVTAAAPAVPLPLVQQLAEGGRIVVPVGDLAFQELVIGRMEGGRLATRVSTGCVFVPLIGRFGWKEERC